MKIVLLVLRELFGMFVDDEFMAVAIVFVVALSAASLISGWLPHLAAGAMLLIGCIGILFWSVRLAARRFSRRR